MIQMGFCRLGCPHTVPASLREGTQSVRGDAMILLTNYLFSTAHRAPCGRNPTFPFVTLIRLYTSLPAFYCPDSIFGVELKTIFTVKEE